MNTDDLIRLTVYVDQVPVATDSCLGMRHIEETVSTILTRLGLPPTCAAQFEDINAKGGVILIDGPDPDNPFPQDAPRLNLDLLARHLPLHPPQAKSPSPKAQALAPAVHAPAPKPAAPPPALPHKRG